MAVLADYQKISRVLPGKPFGNGLDGDATISSTQTQSQTRKSCSGSAGSNSLALDSAGFSDGDVVYIHQTRGTGVGQWEINRVSSGGGTSTLTLQKNLQFTYTDSGNSQAQVIKIPMYKNLTINSGVDLNAPDWNGDQGGFVIAAVREVLTVVGNSKANGNHGNATGGDGARGIGAGFEGGIGRQGQNAGDYAEGTPAARAQSGNGSPNGNGGGGGKANGGSNNGGGGGGGGHRIAGGNSSTAGAGGQYAGQGGSSAGATDLTTLVFGGGGGGAGNGATESNGAGGGGAGGGGIIFFCGDIQLTGLITSNGGNGGNGWRGGGGGAGGSILIVCKTGSLGTNRITATYGQSGGGGNGGNGGGNATGEGANTTSDSHGGNGSNGRIAVHHSGTITGSTSSPVFTDVSDPSLIESSGGGGFMRYMIGA